MSPAAVNPSDKKLQEAKAAKVERAKRYLTGSGVTREDSDDELGIEDHPWEWIYQEEPNSRQDDASINEEEMVVDLLNAEATSTPSGRAGRKRKISKKAGGNARPKIIGAKMGNFECKIGDCVLLKAEGTNEAWVGLICEFMEDDEGEMVANFMWFATEKEIRNKEKKRTDFMQVRDDGTYQLGQQMLTLDRTSFIYPHRGIIIHWLPSMGRPASYLRNHSSQNIPRVESQGTLASMERRSYAEEAAIPGQRHIPTSSSGRMFSMAQKKISSVSLSESKPRQKPHERDGESGRPSSRRKNTRSQTA